MAIVGLGTDIVEVSRIADVIERTGERLAQRILAANEWVTYQRHGQKIRYLAKRFAVKEAAAKALGTGIRDGLAFNQFEVLNDVLGKPQLRLSGRAAQLAAQMGINAVHVSISDERRYACATVIMERTT